MSESTSSGLSAAPTQCPRRAKRVASAARGTMSRWVNFADLHPEPFRLFFPGAVLAGLIGVALWPVMLLGWTENYPGPSHARLMVQGFFGGFIFGFMGTAMPRLVGARPLSAREAFSLLTLFVGNVGANTLGMNVLADWLFAAELVFLFSVLKRRCHSGRSGLVCGESFRNPPTQRLSGSALSGSRKPLAPSYC